MVEGEDWFVANGVTSGADAAPGVVAPDIGGNVATGPPAGLRLCLSTTRAICLPMLLA